MQVWHILPRMEDLILVWCAFFDKIFAKVIATRCVLFSELMQFSCELQVDVHATERCFLAVIERPGVCDSTFQNI